MSGRNTPWDLADSLKYAEKFVDGDPFVVLLGDTIYSSSVDASVTSQIIKVFEERNKSTIAVERVPNDKLKNYGIKSGSLIESGIWDIESLIEKPCELEAPSNMGVTGTYVLTNSIFVQIKKLKPGKNGEYQLTDALSSLCKDESLLGYEFKGQRYDIGNKELWIKSFFEFAKRNKRFEHLFH